VWNRGRTEWALGLAAPPDADFVRDNLLGIQGELVNLMGRTATGVEDLPAICAKAMPSHPG